MESALPREEWGLTFVGIINEPKFVVYTPNEERIKENELYGRIECRKPNELYHNPKL